MYLGRGLQAAINYPVQSHTYTQVSGMPCGTSEGLRAIVLCVGGAIFSARSWLRGLMVAGGILTGF